MAHRLSVSMHILDFPDFLLQHIFTFLDVVKIKNNKSYTTPLVLVCRRIYKLRPVNTCLFCFTGMYEKKLLKVLCNTCGHVLCEEQEKNFAETVHRNKRMRLR